jgi:hypothetical protein
VRAEGDGSIPHGAETTRGALRVVPVPSPSGAADGDGQETKGLTAREGEELVQLGSLGPSPAERGGSLLSCSHGLFTGGMGAYKLSNILNGNTRAIAIRYRADSGVVSIRDGSFRATAALSICRGDGAL